MGLGKIIGVFLLIYAVLCVIFNWVGLCVNFIPNLGVAGSWIFNPFGILLSDTLATYFMSNIGDLGWALGTLFPNGASWAIGGIVTVFWVCGLSFFSLFLFKR